MLQKLFNGIKFLNIIKNLRVIDYKGNAGTIILLQPAIEFIIRYHRNFHGGLSLRINHGLNIVLIIASGTS